MNTPLLQNPRVNYWYYRWFAGFIAILSRLLFWPTAMRDRVLALGHIGPDIDILEVGCGRGFTTELLAKQATASRITATDPNPYQLSRARRRNTLRSCTFQVTEASAIAFPDDYFDRYIAINSVQFWREPTVAINEAYRVLKPGGMLVISGPSQPTRANWRTLLRALVHAPTRAEYEAWLQAAGFVEVLAVDVTAPWLIGRLPFTAFVAQRPDVVPQFPARQTTQASQPGRSFKVLRLLPALFAGYWLILIAIWARFRHAIGRLFGRS